MQGIPRDCPVQRRHATLCFFLSAGRGTCLLPVRPAPSLPGPTPAHTHRMYMMTPKDHMSQDLSYFSGPSTSGAASQKSTWMGLTLRTL